MKSNLVRVLITSLLVTLAVSLIVGLLGLILRWDNPVKFSDGFFWAGSMLIVIALLSVLGGFGIRGRFDVQYAQSAGDMSLGERTKRWVSDMTQGYNLLSLFLLSGVFTFGMSILVGSLF